MRRLALAPAGDRDKKSGNNCSFCSSRICRAKDLGSTKKFCLVYNPQKPVPASASDNERTFVFSSRTYVDVVKPDTMKGVSWQTIQDTVKEHKGKVAPLSRLRERAMLRSRRLRRRQLLHLPQHGRCGGADYFEPDGVQRVVLFPERWTCRLAEGGQYGCAFWRRHG